MIVQQLHQTMNYPICVNPPLKLIDIVSMMITLLDIPVILLAEAALSRAGRCTIGAKSPYAFRANNALPFKYAYEPITVENH